MTLSECLQKHTYSHSTFNYCLFVRLKTLANIAGLAARQHFKFGVAAASQQRFRVKSKIQTNIRLRKKV